MKENRSAESGRTFLQMVRGIGIVAGSLLAIWIIIHFCLLVLMGDTAVEGTLRELTTRAIDISTQLLNNQTTDLKKDQGKTDQGYPVSIYIEKGKFFEIILDRVPKSLCERLQARKSRQVTSLYVNGMLSDREEVPCYKRNQMAFEYNVSLSENVSSADKPRKTHCRSDSDCESCSQCQNGRCQSQCGAEEICSLSLNGRHVCCPEARIQNGMCCSYMEEGACCWGREKCCPPNKPIHLKDGTCADCFDTRVFSLGTPPSLEACLSICPNRVDFGADELCMLPVCVANQFTSREGTCVDCDQGGSFETSEKECSKCPGRIYENGRCSLACPEETILNDKGVCVACDSLNGISLAEGQVCIDRCANREIVDKKCALKVCPKGFVRNKEGDCLSCDQSGALPGVSEEVCAQCSNRIVVQEKCVLPCPAETFRAEDGRCVACSEEQAVAVAPGECQKCPDRMALQHYCFAACEQGQFRDGLGACHSCFDLGSYPVWEVASCAICPNRSVLLHQDGGRHQLYCRPQTCPMDYFSDNLGACHDCFGEMAIQNTNRGECEKCSNRFLSVVDQTCFVKPNCPTGQLLDSYGQCQVCGSETEVFSVAGRPEACDVCPNRYVFGSWCRVCPPNVKTLTNKAGCDKCGGQWDNRIGRCFP